MARKKSSKSFEPPGPKELNGYERGDIVYCFRWPDELLSEGEIKWFHEETEGGINGAVVRKIRRNNQKPKKK
jgi:hypothetical protein